MGCETLDDIKELAHLKADLEKDPNNVDLLLKIGMLLFDPFIDMKAGRPYFDKAMQLDPKNPDLPFWKGYALYHNECAYKESRELFERALSLDPNRAEFYYMMFYIFWHSMDDKKQEQKYLLKAIELQPKWIDPREQYIVCLILNNKLDEAEHELEIAYVVLEKYYQGYKKIGANILEQYYIDSGNITIGYEIKKGGLDETRKEIEEKRKAFNAAVK